MRSIQEGSNCQPPTSVPKASGRQLRDRVAASHGLVGLRSQQPALLRHARAERVERRDISHPLDRLRRRHEAVGRRNVQACGLSRLRLLHPARGPWILSPTGSRTRRPRSTALYSTVSLSHSDGGVTTSRFPALGGDLCYQIAFADDDAINGPLHTNDDLLVCGLPPSADTHPDVIGKSAPPPQGWSRLGLRRRRKSQPQLRRPLQR